jgi:hypothetical protein
VAEFDVLAAMSATVEEKDGSLAPCLCWLCGSPDEADTGVGRAMEGDRRLMLPDEGVAVKGSDACRPSIG